MEPNSSGLNVRIDRKIMDDLKNYRILTNLCSFPHIAQSCRIHPSGRQSCPLAGFVDLNWLTQMAVAEHQITLQVEKITFFGFESLPISF